MLSSPGDLSMGANDFAVCLEEKDDIRNERHACGEVYTNRGENRRKRIGYMAIKS